YLVAGRTDDAAATAARALQLAGDHDEKANRAYALRVLGEVHIQRNNAEESAKHYRAALDLAESLHLRPLAAHCQWGLAQVLEQIGDRQEATRHRESAVPLFEGMDMRL